MGFHPMEYSSSSFQFSRLAFFQQGTSLLLRTIVECLPYFQEHWFQDCRVAQQKLKVNPGISNHRGIQIESSPHCYSNCLLQIFSVFEKLEEMMVQEKLNVQVHFSFLGSSSPSSIVFQSSNLPDFFSSHRAHCKLFPILIYRQAFSGHLQILKFLFCYA